MWETIRWEVRAFDNGPKPARFLVRELIESRDPGHPGGVAREWQSLPFDESASRPAYHDATGAIEQLFRAGIGEATAGRLVALAAKSPGKVVTLGLGDEGVRVDGVFAGYDWLDGIYDANP